MKAAANLIFVVSAALTYFAPPNVRTIIQRSVKANTEDWEAAPDYAYFECDQQGTGTKTYEVFMILGSPYQRLVAVDRKQLSPEDQERERQKLGVAIVQRRNESERERAQRITKYQRDRKRNHLLMAQLTKAFDFRLLGEEKLGRFDVYTLQAIPHGGYQPPNTEAQVLTGMQGKLWIDKKTFQWVKVEAEVTHPVSIEGFFARVEPGTRFELEKMPVTNDIWLPKHFAMKSRSRILVLFSHKTQEDETYFNYEKTSPIQAADLSK
jgi:hypothetical protein